MFLRVLDGSSSNCEGNIGGRISSDVLGSDEGSRAESEGVEDEGLGSAARKSSWLDLCSSWRGLFLDMKVEYSSILSRNSLASAKDFRRNNPPVATSRAQAESLSRPSKELRSSQDGRIDRIGPDVAKSTNLHHAMPMGSFSHC